MIAFAPYLHLLHTRAEWLALVLLVAFCAGEFPARFSGLHALLTRGSQRVASLGRKLDRPNRSIATRVYRGIVALSTLLVLAVVAGAALSRHHPLVELLLTLLMVAWFGRAMAPYGGWKLWRRATADTTPLELPGLELPGLDYLFADSHAVLRYSITTRAESFAVGVVGAAFWYVAGGALPLLVYLMLATARTEFRGPAFGWAAQRAFALADALPRLIARLLCVLAGIFTPQAHPLRAAFCTHWSSFIARLFDVTTGGPSPTGILPWIGTGTARLTPAHLRRALLLQTVATLLLILALALPTFR